MTKSELIARLIEKHPFLSQKDAEHIVGVIFGEITKALSQGRRVELRDFGVWSVKQRDARTARNPRTGDHVAVQKKEMVAFKTGRKLRERIN